MSTRSHLQALAFALVSPFFIPSATAQVSCWAPGMSSPVTLKGDAGSTSVSLGKPYRYEIHGVAGRIELGNSASGAVLVDGQFRQKYLVGYGPVVSSTAFIKLQTNLLNVYPKYIGVTGTSPGNPASPVEDYGPTWTLADPKNPASVNLTFHSASSGLLGSLLPGVLAPAYYNINPTGYFYVLGICHWSPPPVTGTLEFSASEVLNGYPVNVSYSIQRDSDDVYRPPFIQAILGNTSVTVLGTPPSSGSAPTVSPAPTPNSGSGLSVNVQIDLAANSGTGWTRIP
ncbi:hypothetical protein JIN85_16450 [Luteolibacter pohnpeiensis]|uniref:Uncharacterized protein n=1 Tax=Luteolibacter pohnpeiensis TaxID=454153 RepID=A0A934S8B4_9BACT|nr:hypothetical protein [Luteolibacter pohnpeiensis]MBK1884012.1 hypothetical protein [Luteolibacter pohnpeiensis]